MPARGTIARGPMAGRRRGKDARSIEFHYWLRREPRFCVQPTGRSGSDSGGVGGATYRRARAPLRAARENRAQGMPTRVMNTTRQVSIQAGSPRFAGLPVSSGARSEEHTSELQSLMSNSYAVFCLKKKIAIVEALAEKPNMRPSD